jgi:acylphosphatase
MKARARVRVGGQVQGVFFRYHTQQLAKRWGVNGWVRNLSDGRVEAVFEGERKDVEEMVKFCRRGPPSAAVADVELRWEQPKGEFSDFSIKW